MKSSLDTTELVAEIAKTTMIDGVVSPTAVAFSATNNDHNLGAY